MSYRTYVNNTQIFGNHELYSEWIEFVKSQGIEVDDDGCYEGEITDFMAALQVIEQITIRLITERESRKEKSQIPLKSFFDFSGIYEDTINQDPDDKWGNSLLDRLFDVVENGYLFLPYTFFNACEEKLERDHILSTNQHFNCFKLKEGETIKVKAN